MRPTIQAAVTLKQYERQLGDLDLFALVEELHKQVEAAEAGDLDRVEEMLISQAHTLDRLFHCLLQDASLTKSGHLLELCLKLGLRAQNQCRATIEALVTMKAPRLVNQTNIAAVQQVNNNADWRGSEAPEVGNGAKQTIGGWHEQRLDARTTDAAGGGDSQMGAVAPFNRPKISER